MEKIITESLKSYTLNDVAKMVRCNVMSLRRLIKEKKIKAYKLRGHWRILHRDLEEYIKKNTTY